MSDLSLGIHISCRLKRNSYQTCLEIEDMDSVEDTAQVSSLATTAGIYDPLNQVRNEIRLLQWVSYPGGDDSVVLWRLFAVSLEEKHKYIALSYVWGDASITENITVNGKAVPVTTNLASALERVRKLIKSSE